MLKNALQLPLTKWWEIAVDVGPALELINKVNILE